MRSSLAARFALARSPATFRSTTRTLTLTLAVFCVSVTHAGGDRPLREARSENGLFTLRIDPGRGGSAKASRGARASLLEARPERIEMRRVWSERLVNPVAPAQAFIRNDGRFVVTLDDYRLGGARNALVVYGTEGERLKRFELRELLRSAGWETVRVRGRAVEWLDAAKGGFHDQPARFEIRLKSGRVIAVDLEKLELIDAPDAQEEAVPAEIAAALESAISDDTENPDQAALDPQDAQALVSALLSMGLELTPAQLEALMRGDAAAESAALSKLHDADDLEDAADDAAALPDSDAHPAAQPLAAADGRSSEGPGGVSVPLPDPRHPVSYVDWLREQTAVVGESAVPQLQAALDQLVPFAGDRALYDRALAGDASALNAPEIRNWLSQNSAALVSRRSALELPYRGFPPRVTDGSLIRMLLPEVALMRDLARVSIVQGHALLTDGQPQAALGQYFEVARSGAQTSQGPTLIEGLMGVAIQHLAAKAMLDLLNSPQSGGVDYAALAERIEREFVPTRPLAEHMQLERAMTMDTLQRLYRVDAETGEIMPDPEGVRWISGFGDAQPLEKMLWGLSLSTVGFDRHVRIANEHFDELTQAVSQPTYSATARELAAIEQRVADPAFRGANPLMGHLLSPMTRASQATVRMEATRRAAQLVARIKAYQQRSGSLPQSLDALGELPAAIDPFSGQRFNYQPRGDDFTLYSIGADAVDDGGSDEKADMLFWPRPARPQ